MDTRCELCIGIEDKPAIAIVTITDMENTVKQRVQLCEDCLDNLADLLR